MNETTTETAFARAGLTSRDAQLLQQALLQGDQALARRKDLGDLYKRIVSMVTTMDAGLSERQTLRADQDRAAISERLERLERAIDGVEGVLRIEIDRVLRRAMAEVAPPPGAPSKRGSLGLGLVLACLLGGVWAGAVFSDRVLAFERQVLGAAENLLRPSPEGGIAAPRNQGR